MNIILADCTCEHVISSLHYTQATDPPVSGTSIRRLLQAMVPGPLVVSVHVDDATVFEQAQQRCRQVVQRQEKSDTKMGT
jgi:hypothetical protein